MSNVFNKYGVQLDRFGNFLNANSFQSISKANEEFLLMRIIRRHRGGDS